MTTAPLSTLTEISAPTIWIVEDSPEDFAVFERALTRSGPLAGLQRFERAEQALEALDVSKDLPDVLVFDLNLPGIDGVEATRRVRASRHAEVRAIPICMLTSSNRGSDRDRSDAAGANGYLVKPRRSSELAGIAAFVRNLAQPAR